MNSTSNIYYEENKKFITLVKQYPILYDKDNRNYKNAAKREKKWRKIAREMGETSK